MAALGCLIPFALFLAGALLGGWLGGADGFWWGGGAGFLLGLAAPAIMALALVQARRKQ